jgi:hypothetical protein
MSASPDGSTQISGKTSVPDLLTGHLPTGFSPALDSLFEDLFNPGLARGPRHVDVEDHVSGLLAWLEEQPSLESPKLVTVRGVFYPAVLMTPGLWERSDAGEGGPEIQWRTPLQDWLFSGFEQWAPSWNLNASVQDNADRPSFAQIGHEDEAFSLLVVVTGPEAGAIPQKLLQSDEMVCNVEITGGLIYRGHLRDAMPARMRTWGKKFDYCLLVDLSKDDNAIERTGAADPYSGYLWECVAPKEWLRGKDTPEIVDSFFVWEHTDFASGPAREYGLEALAHKHAYIERHFGELELIQKSGPVVPGEPTLATESFYSVLERGSM